jgi:replication initiation and membrane attachment protein
MRVSNVLEFTENHRYVTFRDFALSALARKVLAKLYQPMAGAFASGLYDLLYHHLAEDATGYSAPDAQRRLFLGLGLDMSPAGRRTLIEHASRLEAVGLLQVFRRQDPATDETLYEYVLQPPLPPAEFFTSPHLTLLLRDCIGQHAVLALHAELVPGPPEALAGWVGREELTVPFYEIFRLGSSIVDPELEAAVAERAAAAERPGPPPARIRHGDILLRFPRGSANRPYVERLDRAPEAMAQLNYLAYKYDLEAAEISRLLDEDGIFRSDGTLRWDELQHRANLMYRQDRKRAEERERQLARIARPERETAGEAGPAAGPAGDSPEEAPFEVPERFKPAVSPELYNAMLRREPYTRILERFFPGAVPDAFARIFERIDLNYRLPEPVINVLIHYLLGTDHAQRLTAKYIDSVASNMLAKGIATFEQAVAYVREQMRLNEKLERRRRGEEELGGAGRTAASGGTGGRSRTTARRKPSMPVVEDRGPVREIPPEELEKMRELVRKLKDDKR